MAEEYKNPVDSRCTPEKLYEFCVETFARTKRLPLLAELEEKFGGIIGPLFDAWELEKRGWIVRGVIKERK